MGPAGPVTRRPCDGAKADPEDEGHRPDGLPLSVQWAKHPHTEHPMSTETESYLASIKDLRAAYEGMTKEQLNAHPVEGKWSAMEVLCHLVDTDLMTAMRIRAAL